MMLSIFSHAYLPSMYLLRSFAHFSIRLFVFSLLSLKSSLYIVSNIPISDMSLPNIFFQSVACLLILLKDESFYYVMKGLSSSFL